MYVLVAFVIFSAALSAAAYYVFVVPQREQNQILIARLREIRSRTGLRARSAPDLIRHEHRGALAAIGDFFEWVGVIRRLQDFINQANLKYRAAEVVSLVLILFISAWLVCSLFVSMLLLRLILALIAGSIPIVWILFKRSQRLSKFEQQLPDCIDLFNRSMKAGHNIHAGLEAIAVETADPARAEFRKVVEELRLGIQIDNALHNLGRRVPLIDLKFFITGLILQRQTGANMEDVLDNMSLLVRERLNLLAKMKAATAQQRFSAVLLCSMPLVFAVGLWFLKREYLVLLYEDDTGSKFLTYAIVSEIVGILMIRKIANPKF